jgi:hypothetical protein
MSCAVRVLVTACAILLTAGAQAQSLQGRYFVVVWGYQGAGNAAEDAHTFAAFYRGDDLAQGTASPATISWLPATRVVRAFGQEKGKNLSLGETLALARQRKAKVQSYGPYEIKADVYRNAQNRIRELNSGKLAYTMINGAGSAVNCILAVSAVAGSLSTGWNWGYAASTQVAQHLSASYPKVDPQAAAVIRGGARAAAKH